MDILTHFEVALDSMEAPSAQKPCIECAMYHGATKPVKGCEECPQPKAADTWRQLKVTKTE